MKVCTTNTDMWIQKRYLKVYIHIQTKQTIKSWLFCINMHTKHTYTKKERIETDIKSYKLITQTIHSQRKTTVLVIKLVIFLSWLGCMLLLTEELEMMQNVAYGPLQLR